MLVILILNLVLFTPVQGRIIRLLFFHGTRADRICLKHRIRRQVILCVLQIKTGDWKPTSTGLSLPLHNIETRWKVIIVLMAEWYRRPIQMSRTCDRIGVTFLHLLVSHILSRRQRHLLLKRYKRLFPHSIVIFHESLTIGTDNHSWDVIHTGALLQSLVSQVSSFGLLEVMADTCSVDTSNKRCWALTMAFRVGATSMTEHTDRPSIFITITVLAWRWYVQRFYKFLGLFALNISRRVKRGNELTAILTARINIIIVPIISNSILSILLLLHSPQIIIIRPYLR